MPSLKTPRTIAVAERSAIRSYWLAVLLLLGLAQAPARADVLDDWNDALLNSIRRENTPPPLAARNLAILHLAIYEAVNSIERTHQPYLKLLPVSGPASAEAAAGAAAFRAARSLFPSQSAKFEQLWKATAARSRTDARSTNGIALGFMAADALLEQCASDAAHTTVAYIPGPQPGQWRRTPPYYRPPDLPQWGKLKLFVLASCEQFRPPPPPALDSARYAKDVNEVKRLGARYSAERTAYETETARFWSDFSGTVTPPGHWNQIARIIANNEGLKPPEKARLLALLNIALSDAGVVCWDAKFKYNFWRPVTAIHRADEDGNPSTVSDPAWEPLLTTPAFPEYLSGHSTFSGAAAEVLVWFFGRDNLCFSVTSDTVPGVARELHAISTVVKEIGRSRVLGGIHFASADEEGQATGRKVAKYVVANCLAEHSLSALR